MTSDEAERIWRELRDLAAALEELAARIATLETRAPDLLDRDDLLRLRDAIDALERSVLDVVRWERDSVVQPLPSLSPSRKIRLKLWEWVAIAAAAAIVGAAGTVVTMLAQSCGGP